MHILVAFHYPRIDTSFLAFVDMLNDMRFGELSDAAVKAFRGLSRPVTYEDGLDPTEL